MFNNSKKVLIIILPFFLYIRCGIVALAMAMNINSCNITVENLMIKAKELLYTIQGELFDGNEKHFFFVWKRF